MSATKDRNLLLHDLGFTERGLRIFTRTIHNYADVLPEDRRRKYWAGGAGEWDKQSFGFS